MEPLRQRFNRLAVPVLGGFTIACGVVLIALAFVFESGRWYVVFLGVFMIVFGWRVFRQARLLREGPASR